MMNHECTPGTFTITVNPTYLRSGLMSHRPTHDEEEQIPEFAAGQIQPLTSADRANIDTHIQAHQELHLRVERRTWTRDFAKANRNLNNEQILQDHDTAIAQLFERVVETNSVLPRRKQDSHSLPR